MSCKRQPSGDISQVLVRALNKLSNGSVLAYTTADDSKSVPLDYRCEMIERFHALSSRPRTPACEKLLHRHKTRARCLNEHRRCDKKFDALRHGDIGNA
jgi:hypothetical protein